nr:hypothetical protein [Tanacetum cinerariifolium]
MTDYSLWEVILNGNSPIPTRVVDGVVQPIVPTTAEQSLAKKNELKARGTLLMALPDKCQLKFNIHKDAKSLMEAIKKRFGGNKETKKRNKADLEDQSLDDFFKNLKIYEAEVKSSSSTSHTTQNIAFVSSQNTNSTNESVSVVPSVTAASTQAPAYILPNVDNLSDAVIYSFFASQSNIPQLDSDDLKQIDDDDLEEMDLKWQMAMLTMRARRFLQRTRKNLGSNETTSIGFDMSKVECNNCIRRGYFARECRSPKDTKNKDIQRRSIPLETSTSNALVSQCDGLESIEARLVVYQQNENAFEEDIKLLKLDVMLRDNALVELRKKFEAAEKERDELKHTLEKFQTSLKNLSKLLASQITDKTGLGYDNQVFHSQVFASDELTHFELDVSVPTSPVSDRYQLGERYHDVPLSYTGTFMLPKPDLVFHDTHTVSKTVPTVFNVKPSTTKPTKEMSQPNRPSAPVIEDWVSDSEDESKGKPMPTQKATSFVQTSEHMKTHRTSVKPVEHPTQAKNRRKDIPKSRVHKHIWNRKAYFVCRSVNHLIKDCDYYEQKMIQVSHGLGLQKTLPFLFDVHGNPQQALKDKGVIDS